MSNVPASVLNPQIRNLLANRGSHGVFADSGRKGNPFRQILPVARQPAQLDQKRLIVGFLRLPFNAAANEPRILSKNVPLQAINDGRCQPKFVAQLLREAFEKGSEQSNVPAAPVLPASGEVHGWKSFESP